MRKTTKPTENRLPHEISRAQKAAYLLKYRTAHQEFHSPEYQLKNYKRRILNFEEAVEQIKVALPPNSRIKYERPPPLHFSKEL